MTRTTFPAFLRVAAVAFVAAGCSNSGNASSGLTAPTAVGGGTGSLAGTLLSYTASAPVGGATVRLGSVVTASATNGEFTLKGLPASGSGVLTASVPGYLFRGAAFTLTGARTGVTVNLIQDAAPFSLTFYREFVRAGLGATSFDVTRPWTVNPSFYFQLLTADTGVRVPDEIINQLKDNFTKSVPELSGGRRAVAGFDQGDGPRAAETGWVNVLFYRTIGGSILGQSTVGGNVATITLRYDTALASNSSTNPNNCASITLGAADHEITHTMGYWHTTDVYADTFSGAGCPGNNRPANTRFHANLMYSRPAGNADPDVDPVASAQSTAPAFASSRLVSCDASIFRR